MLVPSCSTLVSLLLVLRVARPLAVLQDAVSGGRKPWESALAVWHPRCHRLSYTHSIHVRALPTAAAPPCVKKKKTS